MPTTTANAEAGDRKGTDRAGAQIIALARSAALTEDGIVGCRGIGVTGVQTVIGGRSVALAGAETTSGKEPVGPR